MRSVLKDIKGERLMLLYISGELSSHDQEEVRRRLAADPAMQQRLEDLRSTYSGVDLYFEGADELTHLNTGRAVNNAIAGVRRFQAELRSKPVQSEPTRRLLLPWWMYPLAAAASILVAAAVFFANIEPERVTSSDVAGYAAVQPQDMYWLTAPVLDPQGVAMLDTDKRAHDLAESFESSYVTAHRTGHGSWRTGTRNARLAGVVGNALG